MQSMKNFSQKAEVKNEFSIGIEVEVACNFDALFVDDLWNIDVSPSDIPTTA